MKLGRILAALLAPLLLLPLAPDLAGRNPAPAQPTLPAPLPSANQGGPGAGETVTFTRTLYQRHFGQNSVSLATGEFGTLLQGLQVFNVDSELGFGALNGNQLTAGVQGSQVGALLDLGSTAELAAGYGYSETVGGGQGFASLHFEQGQLQILEDYASQTHQPFPRGQAFFDAPAPDFSQPVTPEADHLYLVRVLDKLDPSFERLAKLYVVEHVPSERITIVWQTLQR
jgi:hypothetical protein